MRLHDALERLEKIGYGGDRLAEGLSELERMLEDMFHCTIVIKPEGLSTHKTVWYCTERISIENNE